MAHTSVSIQPSAKPATGRNRRATIRYRCAPATVGKVYAACDREFQRAWILDLSLSGVGMQLARPLQAGHSIAIDMRSNDGTRVIQLNGIVMHCSQVPQGDWYVGCQFGALLTPEDLDQLL